jgi:tRNA-(ms[2]io[6]A)-hydroxylase
MLGLLTPTDPRWIDVALADFNAVLLDHFHCELKAASNASALMARYPAHPRLVRELATLAQEELSHVVQVHDELVRRGVRPYPPETDPYAAALRRAAGSERSGPESALVDRLTVAALIEARSCERFAILREHAPTDALRDWYKELFASEARHYRLFASLAEDVVGADEARERLARLAEREADIVGGMPLLARVH